MKDRKETLGLALQGVWILLFLLAGLLLEGKLRTLAILCACGCAYTLIHSLIRARAERKLSEGGEAAGEEKRDVSEGEKP